MKITLIDIETGGLDPAIHEIIEIGAVIFDSETLEVLEEFEMKVKPQYGSFIKDEVKAVNGYNKEDWENAVSLSQALAIFADHAKDSVLMAQNVTFDWSFLQKGFRSEKIKHTIHYHHLDLASMAWEHFPELRSGKESLSLKNLAKLVGVDPEPPVHRALYGAKCAFEIYKRLRQFK